MSPVLRDRLTKARDELDRLTARRQQWQTRLDEARAALDALLARADDELLNDDAAGAGLQRERARLRDELDTAQRAVSAADARIDAAKLAVLEAEADALRRRREQAETELERHEARTLELLAALREHEGVDYAVATVYADRVDMRGSTPPTVTDRRRQDLTALRWQEALVRTFLARRVHPGFKSEVPLEARRAVGLPDYDYDLHEQMTPADFPACLAGPEALFQHPSLVTGQRRAVA